MIGRLLATATVAVILMGAAGSAPASVHAGPQLTVTKSEDTNDGVCDADCSLREAVTAANADLVANEIIVGVGTRTLSLPIVGADTPATGDLEITSDMALTGAGVGQTTIDAAGIDRAFEIYGGAQVTITGVTITGGREDVMGGAGIANGGNLTLRSSLITGNEGVIGGGITNYGILNMRASSINTNISDLGGGGLWNAANATAEIDSSTISGNTAVDPSHAGGGISNRGMLTVTNSTVSGNSSVSGGSAIISIGESAQSTFESSTIAFNHGSVADADAVRTVGFTTTTFVNTIIAENDGYQCFVAEPAILVSNGHNLASDATCNLTATGDIPFGDAQLSSLDDNGGPTMTHALMPGSDAIDAGDPALCPDEDQRGQFRDGVCDIGAYEFVYVPTWGDIDCSGAVSARDNQALLRHVLAQPALSQNEPCPDIGVSLGIIVPAGQPQLIWGDSDCNREISARDNQALLRHVLSQPPLSQSEPCPDIGEEIFFELAG